MTAGNERVYEAYSFLLFLLFACLWFCRILGRRGWWLAVIFGCHVVDDTKQTGTTWQEACNRKSTNLDPICSRCLNVTDRRTDRQRDKQTDGSLDPLYLKLATLQAYPETRLQQKISGLRPCRARKTQVIVTAIDNRKWRYGRQKPEIIISLELWQMALKLCQMALKFQQQINLRFSTNNQLDKSVAKLVHQQRTAHNGKIGAQNVYRVAQKIGTIKSTPFLYA